MQKREVQRCRGPARTPQQSTGPFVVALLAWGGCVFAGAASTYSTFVDCMMHLTRGTEIESSAFVSHTKLNYSTLQYLRQCLRSRSPLTTTVIANFTALWQCTSRWPLLLWWAVPLCCTESAWPIHEMISQAIAVAVSSIVIPIFQFFEKEG